MGLAAIAKYHGLGILKTWIYFSQFWRLKVWNNFWRLSPGVAPGLSWAHAIGESQRESKLSDWGETGKASSLIGVLSNKGTNPIMKVLVSWAHLNLITIQRPYLQIHLHWRVRCSIYEFWGDNLTCTTYISKSLNNFRPWKTIFQTRGIVTEIMVGVASWSQIYSIMVLEFNY